MAGVVHAMTLDLIALKLEITDFVRIPPMGLVRQ